MSARVCKPHMGIRSDITAVFDIDHLMPLRSMYASACCSRRGTAATMPDAEARTAISLQKRATKLRHNFEGIFCNDTEATVANKRCSAHLPLFCCVPVLQGGQVQRGAVAWNVQGSVSRHVYPLNRFQPCIEHLPQPTAELRSIRSMTAM